MASLIQISSFMSWLPTDDTWTPRTSAKVFSCGTAAISTSTATAPDLYPAAVVDSAAPAIVPPVATMTMRGLAGCADRSRWRAEAVHRRGGAPAGERSEHLCLQS